MKEFIKVLRKSKFLTCLWCASVVTLGNIIGWLTGFIELSINNIITSPIFGIILGFIVWEVYKVQDKVRAEKNIQIRKE